MIPTACLKLLLTFYRSNLKIKEIITNHRNKLDNEKTWRITVRRQNILEDMLRAMQNNPDLDAKYLKVKFLGEPGINEGGLTREFFRLLMKSIDDSGLILDGAPGHRVPRHNPIAFQVCNYVDIFSR